MKFNLKSVNASDRAFFENLLIEHRINFHETRTSDSLMREFGLFKKLNLVKDQMIIKIKQHDEQINHNDMNKQRQASLTILNKKSISELEQELDDEKIDQHIELSEECETEMQNEFNNVLRDIKHAEADLFLWQIMCNQIENVQNHFLKKNESNTLALLFNEHFTYSMQKRQVS